MKKTSQNWHLCCFFMHCSSLVLLAIQQYMACCCNTCEKDIQFKKRHSKGSAFVKAFWETETVSQLAIEPLCI